MKKAVVPIIAALMSLLFLISCDDESPNLCGNGVLDPGEQCDPGIDYTQGTCSDECKFINYCGNGLLEPGEDCDDGNFVNGDGCSRECRVEVGCGNGVIDVTMEGPFLVYEECDDGNVQDGDGCSAECKLEEGRQQECGNGLLEYPEECDDGNVQDGDGCSSDCQVENGCGDGSLDTPPELCDDGNTISGDGCSARCRIEFKCGDGVCDAGHGENREICPIDCAPKCGDGIVDDGTPYFEECDDGNTVSGDGCSAGCQDEDGQPTCGNGILELDEECDDGNTDSGDGCSERCKWEFVIGDGYCDAAKGETCKYSHFDCCPNCGNGVLDPGEQCDSEDFGGETCEGLCYDGGELRCTDWCEISTAMCTGTGPVCGDGIAECLEECDGTDFKGLTCGSFGYAEGELQCNGCQIDISGCSGLLYYLFSDFDSPNSLQGWEFNGSWSAGTPGSGPSSCHSGSACISSSLNGKYSSGLDANTCNAVSPVVRLTNATNPVLTFWSWLQAEDSSSGCYDGGAVEVSLDGGLSWTRVSDDRITPQYDDTSDSIWCQDDDTSSTQWTQYTVDLSDYAGHEIRIRFVFESDSSVTREGWYIDDVKVEEAH